MLSIQSKCPQAKTEPVTPGAVIAAGSKPVDSKPESIDWFNFDRKNTCIPAGAAGFAKFFPHLQ